MCGGPSRRLGSPVTQGRLRWVPCNLLPPQRPEYGREVRQVVDLSFGRSCIFEAWLSRAQCPCDLRSLVISNSAPPACNSRLIRD